MITSIIVVAVVQSFILQCLEFMRTDSTANKQQALIVNLGAVQLEHFSQVQINEVLKRNPELGISSSKCIREFLLPQAPSDCTTIKKNDPHTKRIRATVFYCSGMSKEQQRFFSPGSLSIIIVQIVQIPCTISVNRSSSNFRHVCLPQHQEWYV